MIRVGNINGFNLVTLFAKIVQVFAKLWPIYRFVSKFFRHFCCFT
jgi:hypothetical protein